MCFFNLYSQTTVVKGRLLGSQSYDNSSYNSNSQNVGIPVDSYSKLFDKLENNYRINKEKCDEIDLSIFMLLRKLKNDTINVEFKKNLMEMEKEIEILNKKNDFSQYTYIISDLIKRYNLNLSNYIDEEEYIKKINEEKESRKRDLEFKKMQEELELLKQEREREKQERESKKKQVTKKKKKS